MDCVLKIRKKNMVTNKYIYISAVYVTEGQMHVGIDFSSTDELT